MLRSNGLIKKLNWIILLHVYTWYEWRCRGSWLSFEIDLSPFDQHSGLTSIREGRNPMPLLLSQIASDAVLEQAYDWLCKRRLGCHYNDDVWHLRFHWSMLKDLIQRQLLAGEYRFSPCRSVPMQQGWIGRWNAEDALVLKAMSPVLGDHLQDKISPHCYHLAGRGGAKAAVMDVSAQCAAHG